MSKFSLSGKIIDKNKKSKSGLKISAYDDDPILNPDDFLGETTTDKDGFFNLNFDESHFKRNWEVLEGTPDVFLQIHDKKGNKIMKTRLMKTKKEIEYHIKLDDHKADDNAIDIYAENTQKIVNMLNEVGINIDWENAINLDVLTNENLADNIRKRIEEFVEGGEERRIIFNSMMAVLSGTVNSFLEERNLGRINYDGPQVPRLPRQQDYNQTIIWPRNE